MHWQLLWTNKISEIQFQFDLSWITEFLNKITIETYLWYIYLSEDREIDSKLKLFE